MDQPTQTTPAQGRAEFARALITRCNERLAQLDADKEICDVPNDCVACPDHFTCPGCPGELKEFLKKHPTAAAIVSNCSTNSIPPKPRAGPP